MDYDRLLSYEEASSQDKLDRALFSVPCSRSSCLGNPSPLQEGSRGICLGSSDGYIRQEAGEQLKGHLAVQWLTVPGSAPCI